MSRENFQQIMSDKAFPLKQEVLFMAGLMGLFALAATIHSTVGVLLSCYIDEYSLVAGSQGLCGTAESVGFIISIVVMTTLLRHFSKKQVLRIMAVICGAVLIFIGIRPSTFSLLFCCYSVFGLAYGIIDSLSSSLLSDLFPGKSAEKMGYLRAVYCLGGIVSPLILSKLLNKGYAWYSVAMFAGLFGVVIVIYYVAVASPRIPEVQKYNDTERKISFHSYIEYLKNHGVLRIVFFGILYYGHQIGLTMWIVRYVTNYLHETTWGGYALTFYWIGAIMTRIFLPRFVSSHRKLLLYGNLFSALFLITGILVSNGKLMCLMVMAAGAAEGAVIPMLVDYACSIDRSNSAIACSSVVFFNNLGSMIIPSLIGALIEFSGARIGIFILPVTSLLCAAIAFRMKNYEKGAL